MTLMNLMLIFLSGAMLGAVVCRLHDDAKLALYRRFIEERLQSPFPADWLRD